MFVYKYYETAYLLYKYESNLLENIYRTIAFNSHNNLINF